MFIQKRVVQEIFRLSCCLILSLAASTLCFNQPCMAAASDNPVESDVSKWLAELTPATSNMQSPYSEKVSSKEMSSAQKRKQKKREGKKASNENISIDFYKVDLHNVFRLLGQISGKNIVVDEGVKGTLTLALQDVPWTFVLQVIKNLKGLSSQEINNTIMIYPASKKMTWENSAAASASLDLSIDNSPSSLPSLNIDGGNTSLGIRKGLKIEKVRFSKTPPEKISQASKLIKKAEYAQQRGDFETASKLYRQAAEIWPDNIGLQKKAAYIALKNDNEITAYNLGKRALALDPNDAEAATIVAVALARMNKPGEAKSYFERAVSGNNVSMDALWNYAVFAFSHNDFRNALRLITRIEAQYVLTPDLMMLKARTYENLGRKEKAIEEYRAILSSGSDVSAEMKQFAKNQLEQLKAAQ